MKSLPCKLVAYLREKNKLHVVSTFSSTVILVALVSGIVRVMESFLPSFLSFLLLIIIFPTQIAGQHGYENVAPVASKPANMPMRQNMTD